jgi:hypothetical protein
MVEGKEWNVEFVVGSAQLRRNKVRKTVSEAPQRNHRVSSLLRSKGEPVT